jgi:hypothetical protein
VQRSLHSGAGGAGTLAFRGRSKVSKRSNGYRDRRAWHACMSQSGGVACCCDEAALGRAPLEEDEAAGGVEDGSEEAARVGDAVEDGWIWW